MSWRVLRTAVSLGVWLWRPGPGLVVLIHDPLLRAGRQHLQRLQELDDGVLFGCRQRLERQPRRLRLAGMRQHRLAQGREQAMMEEGRLVRRTPQPFGEKAAVALP